MDQLQSWIASLPAFARDLLGIAAVIAIIWGVAQIFIPAAFIIGGAIVLFGVLVHAGVIKLGGGS